MLDSMIGRGGMGVVYEARDERLQRAVAIKTILPSTDPVMRDRFLRAARSAAAVSHPHISPVVRNRTRALENDPAGPLRTSPRFGEIVARAMAAQVTVARAFADRDGYGLLGLRHP